jgi:isocitrate dehydrogenase
MNNSTLKKIVDAILLDILNKNREYALLVSKNLDNIKKISY